MNKRLMIVEDNKDLSDIYKIFFQSSGFTVLCTHDGKEALQKVIDFRPDIMLCDIKMPKLSGFDVIEFLNTHVKLRQKMIVIIMSAYGDDQMLKRAQQLGIKNNHYLVKSQITLNQVLNKLKNLLKPQAALKTT